MIPTPSPSIGGTPIFVAFIALTFYGLGAGYLESFVNYPLWYIVGETDGWVAYHQALGRAGDSSLALSLIANVLLCVRRPPAVPASSVAATLSLLLVGTASTMVIRSCPDDTRCRLRLRSSRPPDLVEPVAARHPGRHQGGHRRLHAVARRGGLDALPHSASLRRRVVDENLDWETMSRFGYEKGDGGD